MLKRIMPLLVVLLSLSFTAGVALAVQIPLNSTKIPQFVDPLPIPAILDLTATPAQTLTMCEFKASVMPNGFAPAVPPYTGTTVWGYVSGTTCPTTLQPTYLGPIIVARRGNPSELKFINSLPPTTTSGLLAWQTGTDQTLHWADPLGNEQNPCAHDAMMNPGVPPAPLCAQNYAGPIPTVVHLHGGEVPPQIDGGPDAWFLSDGTAIGHGYYSKDGPTSKNYAIYRYPNSQEAAPIWFHDHALGVTRLNVYAGLAGGYLLIDPPTTLPAGLTATGLSTQPVLTPIIIQDRMFDVNGQLFFPALGINPEHPFWVPEFLGDTILVNGKVWPFLTVEPRRYRFLFLNGSNARTYEMFLINPATGVKGPAFWQIGTDDGYLDSPVKVDPAFKQNLIMMPGERADVIIDFTGVAPGTRLVLRNSAKAPYPAGAPTSGSTTGTIMQFRVGNVPPANPCPSGLCGANDSSFNPAAIPTPTIRVTNPIVRLANPATGVINVPVAKTRQLTLNEVMGMKIKPYPGGPLEILVNNTKWSGFSGMSKRSDFQYVKNPPITGIETGYSEVMDEGTTEVWEIINLTADAHPMHTHLTSVQIIDRYTLDVKGYTAAYNLAFGSVGAPVLTPPGLPPGCITGLYCPGYGPPLNYNVANLDGAIGGNPALRTPAPGYLVGLRIPPAANEQGWKDTVMVPPGMVTRFAVRFAPTDTPAGTVGYYPFDTNGGHGYAWHCHIIDHEDNEMMRPDLVTPLAGAIRSYYGPLGGDY